MKKKTVEIKVDNYINEIGNRLKICRKKKDLSQKKVAEDLKISKPILSQYESSQRIPSVPKLIMLAQYYQVSLDYLCGLIPIDDTDELVETEKNAK